MPHDLYMSLGIVILALAIPSALSALIDGRAPRLSALLVLIGGGTIIYALRTKPGGYTLLEVPEAFVTVVAHYIF